MSTRLVEVQELFHEYTGGIQALRGVNLTIYDGDYIGLIGQNGSGKTTLARHFNGLLKPTSGRVLVGGADTQHQRVSELSRTVGYVFQNPDHMLFARTIEEEIAYGPTNLGISEVQVQERVEKAIEVTGLGSVRKDSPFFFGKGMRRKITIAAILAMNPRMIVIDEPTTGLDFKGSQAVMALVNELHNEGHTIVIISHDMKMIAENVQRCVVMYEGRVLFDLPPRELFVREAELKKAFISPPQATRISLRLGKYGIRPDCLSPEELLLELARVCGN